MVHPTTQTAWPPHNGRLLRCRISHQQSPDPQQLSNAPPTHYLSQDNQPYQEGSKTPSLQTISKSTLKWLHQLNPAKAAWSLWTQAIQKLYTKPRLPSQLNHSLRPWKSTASQVRTWNYQINPETKTVYKKVDD